MSKNCTLIVRLSEHEQKNPPANQKSCMDLAQHTHILFFHIRNSWLGKLSASMSCTEKITMRRKKNPS